MGLCNLRPYQQEFYDKIRHSIATGHKRIMCVSPCGSGKSVVIQKIIESAENKGNSVLVLCHRREIIDQLSERLSIYKNTSVGMVQTITRRLNSTPEPSIIIIDEAHTAKSASYLRILEYFKNSYALYFTATPQRTDGKGFDDIADDMIDSVSVSWLIDNGYLTPFEYYAPKTLINASELSVTAGEYDGKQATSILDKPKIYGDVLECYRKYANWLKTIVYCSSVEHSEKTAQAFNDAGISAAHIDGKTNKQTRSDIIRRFRTGEVTVLCNYSLIVEGFDVPDAGCVICLRPTQSMIVHIQSTMRCMRTSPGKSTCIILDMVGNYERHGLPSDDREWSLQGRQKRTRYKEQNTVKARVCEKCFRTYAGSGPICPYCGNNNGKTRQEIEADERAELERITAENRKQKRIEVGRARTLDDLKRIAKERNYSPGWAYQMARAKHIPIR